MGGGVWDLRTQEKRKLAVGECFQQERGNLRIPGPTCPDSKEKGQGD